MTLEEFRRLAETWGGDIERWPPAVRAPALAMAQAPEAVGVLEAASEIDRLASTRPAVDRARSRDVAFRVMQQIAGDRVAPAAPAWAGRLAALLFPTASLAGAAVAGMLLAVLVPYVGAVSTSDETMVLSMVLDSGSMAAGWILR